MHAQRQDTEEPGQHQTQQQANRKCDKQQQSQWPVQLDPKQVNDNYFMIQRTDEQAQRNGQEQDNDKTCAVQTLLPTLPCGIPVYLLCDTKASINPSTTCCNY